jgi:hypothetical protein
MKKVALLITVLLLVVLYAQIDTQAPLWYLRTMQPECSCWRLPVWCRKCLSPLYGGAGWWTSSSVSWLHRLILAGGPECLAAIETVRRARRIFKTHATWRCYGVALVLPKSAMWLAVCYAPRWHASPHLGVVNLRILIASLVLVVVAGYVPVVVRVRG